MTCHPVAIISRMLEEAIKQHSTGKGETYMEQMSKKMQSPDCGVEMMSGFMTDHSRRIHETYPNIEWYRLQVSQHDHLTQIYDVIPPKTTSKFNLPFPWYSGFLQTRNGLRNHLNMMKFMDSLQIMEDNPTP